MRSQRSSRRRSVGKGSAVELDCVQTKRLRVMVVRKRREGTRVAVCMGWSLISVLGMRLEGLGS